MITFLSIKNFALIEDVFLELSPGMNVLSGETGAGKSIILDALGLLLGQKARAGLIRKGASRLIVSAGFSLKSARLRDCLEELGILWKEGDDLLIRREAEEAGKSRAFINDAPVGVAALAKVGELLVNLHGQHDQQLLLRATEQRDVLDDFGRHFELRALVAQAYEAWRLLVSQKEAATLPEEERQRRLDLYRYQLEEISKAQPRAGEEEELEALLPQMKNAARIKSVAMEGYDLLVGEEGSAAEKIRQAQRRLESLLAMETDVGDGAALLQDALEKLEETSSRLDRLQNRFDVDPHKIDDLLNRMDDISKLKKKYGPTFELVLRRQKQLEEDVFALEQAEEQLKNLEEEASRAAARLSEQCQALHDRRVTVGKRLSLAVEKELKDLGLARASFQIRVQRLEGDLFSPTGFDKIDFLFSANPGEEMGHLSRVASGGELSRVMLALKTVFAKSDPVGTLVFDEVDTGVGGPLGAVLGKKMAALGKTHQVITVTHLAPIAACAENHFSVEKNADLKRTTTLVRKLDLKDRVKEVARMLGSSGGDESSIEMKHAEKLLGTLGS